MNPRVERVAQAVRESGAAGIVVQLPVNMGYFVPFEEDGHERFLAMFIKANSQVSLIAPGLSRNQAERAGFTDLHTWIDGENPADLVSAFGRGTEWETGTVLVDDYLKAAHLLTLQRAWPQARFERGGPVLQEVMRTKDEDEIDRMKRAAQIADEAWEEVWPTIRLGETEAAVARRLANAMDERGGRTTFTVVATGAMGAEPHHASDATVIQSGDVVVCDFGCLLEGYNSDITRVVAVGEPDPEADRVYDAVYRAHVAGAVAALAGVARTEVDKAARNVIEDAGYGHFFNHRLGHGIGRNGHEEPNLTPGDTRTLREADCFSIEPGVYLAGRFGVRLENIYTLRAHGAVSLNAPISPTLVRVPQN